MLMPEFAPRPSLLKAYKTINLYTKSTNHKRASEPKRGLPTKSIVTLRGVKGNDKASVDVVYKVKEEVTALEIISFIEKALSKLCVDRVLDGKPREEMYRILDHYFDEVIEDARGEYKDKIVVGSDEGDKHSVELTSESQIINPLHVVMI